MAGVLCLSCRCLRQAGSDDCGHGDRQVDLIDDSRAVVECGKVICSFLSGWCNEPDEWLVCECVVCDCDEQ